MNYFSFVTLILFKLNRIAKSSYEYMVDDYRDCCTSSMSVIKSHLLPYVAKILYEDIIIHPTFNLP